MSLNASPIQSLFEVEQQDNFDASFSETPTYENLSPQSNEEPRFLQMPPVDTKPSRQLQHVLTGTHRDLI